MAFAGPASAGAVVFDSLDSGTASTAYATVDLDPSMSATFKTGASSLHVEVALLLSAPFPEDVEPDDTVTINLDGGIPISDLSFDPIAGLSYLNGSAVSPVTGPVIKSVTFAVSSLPAALTVERYNQFADVSLNPNSLYWIEVRVNGEPEVAWGATDDVTGPGVANNYMAWFETDDLFFLNKGVQPFPPDNALQMEVDAAPEPSTWLMVALGFTGLVFLAPRAPRRAAST